MRSALDEMLIMGVETNLDFQYQIMRHPVFCEGKQTPVLLKYHEDQLGGIRMYRVDLNSDLGKASADIPLARTIRSFP